MTYQIWKDVRDEVLRKMERYKSEERSNFEELVDTAIWLEEHKDEDSDDYSTMRRLETFLIVHRTSSVDDYFDEIKQLVVEAIKNRKINADYSIYLTMVAKYIERIGDHATNLAEWVIFSITGEHE